MKRELLVIRNFRWSTYLGLLSLGLLLNLGLSGPPCPVLAQDNAQLADFQKRIDELTAQEQALREKEEAILRGQSTAGETEQAPPQPSNGDTQLPTPETSKPETSQLPATSFSHQGPDSLATPQQPIKTPNKQAGSVESSKEIVLLRKENQRLKSALKETKIRLVVAETQIERLSALLEGRQPPPPRERDLPPSDSRKESKLPPPAQEKTPSLARTTVKPKLESRNSVPILSVATLNVNLRSGPGISFPAVETAPRGAKFVYESQEGNWYKVITASGERLWVNASAVTLGQLSSPQRAPGENSGPTKQDYQGNEEKAADRAFDALRQR